MSASDPTPEERVVGFVIWVVALLAIALVVRVLVALVVPIH